MKKFVKMLLCGMVVTLLAGCSGDGKYEVDMKQLKNTVGEYQFQELAWDSSTSQVEELLDSTLESMGTAGKREAFLAENTFEWTDVEGDFTCEFEQGRLDSVSILFKPEEDGQEQFWKDIRKELFAIYGSVEADVRSSTSEEMQISTESETYLWEETVERRTAMTVSKLSVNGEFKYIALSVYVIPTEKGQ